MEAAGLNRRTRQNILWNLRRDITRYIGGTWTVFQEKAGVFGLVKNIRIFGQTYLQVGIVVRASWDIFDMTTQKEFFQDLGAGVFIDEQLVYESFYRIIDPELSVSQKKPTIIRTSGAPTAAISSVNRFLDSLAQNVKR
jgi:hypothetical protein